MFLNICSCTYISVHLKLKQGIWNFGCRKSVKVVDGSDVCTDAWTAAYSTYGHCKLRINSICRRYCRRYPFALRGTIWRDYPVFDG